MEEFIFKTMKKELKKVKNNLLENLDLEKNQIGIIYQNGDSYNGFMSFTDGSLTLSAPLWYFFINNSGNTPSYLEEYYNRLEILAEENGKAEGLKKDSEELYDYINEYNYDECLYLQILFMYYKAEGKGDGQNKIVLNCDILSEYGKRSIEEANEHFKNFEFEFILDGKSEKEIKK